MMSDLLSGFAFVLQPMSFALMTFGVAMGVVIGALPGLTGSMGIILMLPLVYRLPSDIALVMLCGLFCGSMFGGSVSAILLRTPGTPSASATVLDGHPLALKGYAGKAIGVAAISSFIGGILSTLCLILISPQLSKIALQFHAADYFALAIFGLTMIASTSGKSIVKGLMSGALGLLIATVGIDPIMGASRFTFGSYQLMNGLPLLPVLIGVFAASEVFEQAGDRSGVAVMQAQDVKNILPSWKEFKSFAKVAVISGLVGVFIGIVPGTGGAIACFLAYDIARKISKRPQEFGQGSLEGIAAPEASNNGTTGGALIPMLTLGVPGDTVTSVMLGALVLIGVRPGPLLFVENAHIVYAIFAGMLVIQFLMLGIGIAFAKIAPRVLKVPYKILMPVILVLCVVGSFSLANNLYHVNIALIFGVIGLFMKKFGYPGAPLVLGVVLGPMAEQNLNRALQLSKNDWSVFVSRPISLIFLSLSAVSIVYAVVSVVREGRKEKGEGA